MSAIYDPLSWKLTWNKLLINSFMIGTFLKVTRRTETTSLSMGADGKGTFVLSHDRSGMVEFVLRREAAINVALSAQMALWEGGNQKGIGELFIEQVNSLSTAAGQYAALVKWPDMEGATDASPITYQLLVEDLSMFNGAQSLSISRG